MIYVKVIRGFLNHEAVFEQNVNDYIADIRSVGHYIIGSKYMMNGENMIAVLTVNDALNKKPKTYGEEE